MLPATEIRATAARPDSTPSSTILHLREEFSVSGIAKELRLPGTGIALTPGDSLLPSMRTSKTEGQANFVNPGIFLVNAGANFDLTPKLKSFLNVNYLRFERTAPIALLLFESPIHNTIGLDYQPRLSVPPSAVRKYFDHGRRRCSVPGAGISRYFFRERHSSRFLRMCGFSFRAQTGVRVSHGSAMRLHRRKMAVLLAEVQSHRMSMNR